jgi:hypothetical protein
VIDSVLWRYATMRKDYEEYFKAVCRLNP